MKAKVKEISIVQTGYSFRSRLEVSSNGNTFVIQMKDLLSDNTVDCSELVKIDMQSVKNSHLVQKNDLIFRSRGLSASSAILLENPGDAVVAAPLIRIRIIKTDLILPEYLNWYISQPPAQAFLNSHAKGTTQKMIGVNAIEELDINVPPIEKQKLIVELAKLAITEKKLQGKLINKREQYISAILMQKAKEG